MSYFRHFPMVEFDGVKMPNITASTLVETYGRDAFFEYTIEDGETPEMLAHRLYRDPEYASFILMLNTIVDPYEEWPMTSDQLSTVVSDKYNDVNGIHHYESTAGNIVSENYPTYDRVPVTNLQYEIDVNDAKRQILLIVPDLMPEVEEQHRKLLSA